MSDAGITYRGMVHQWQCDHMGHMNVMWYVGKFDEATWNFIALLGITPSYLRDRQRGMAAVQQNISYKRELMPGDIVEVRSRLVEIRERVIRFVHEMHHAESGELAAICEIIAVHMDRAVRKACAFPPEIMAAAERMLRQTGEAKSAP